jgi:hypothetical protein
MPEDGDVLVRPESRDAAPVAHPAQVRRRSGSPSHAREGSLARQGCRKKRLRVWIGHDEHEYTLLADFRLPRPDDHARNT